MLSFLNGKTVKVGGIVIAWLSTFLFIPAIGHEVGYVVGLTVATIALTTPEAFAWLSDFAGPEYWPAFVGLGVAILFAAHFGGTRGLLAVIGPLTTYDGMYFEQNY